MSLSPKMTRAERLRREGRRAAVGVPVDLLGDLILGRTKMLLPGLPPDAVMVNAASDWRADGILLTYVHESFDVCGPGEMSPLLSIDARYTPTLALSTPSETDNQQPTKEDER